jgi:transcriptional regulator with XRE-family HTH domain
MSWTITSSIITLPKTISETIAMKQPELGKKILELRKAKGFTQEELVDKCNISVRTLQRIETGEVTPRSYTIKTILAALDDDLSAIQDTDETVTRTLIQSLKKHLLLEIHPAVSPDYFTQQLNIAWISGLLYFLIGFFEGAAEYFRYKDQVIIYSTTFYILIKTSYVIAHILFQRGFIFLGGLYKNYLLRIISFILIFGNILIIGYDIASLFYDSLERQFVLGSEAIVFGCIGILYGISLRRLRKQLGTVATYAGVFELLTGCFFLTVVLSFVGFIVRIPAELLEIIMLYKSVDIIKSKQEERILTAREAGFTEK